MATIAIAGLPGAIADLVGGACRSLIVRQANSFRIIIGAYGE